jgi:cell division protein FtsA
MHDPIVGLDVGTTKICCVIAEPDPAGGIEVIGLGSAPSRGLRKGVVVNIDSTVEAIKEAVTQAEEMAGVEVARVYVGVAGGHIRGVNSRGVVAISGKHREVDETDVQRAVDAARAINLPQDREIIHVLPQTFVVDDQDCVREPIGMTGVRLEVEVHIVSGASASVQNVIRSVNRAGLAVQDLVLQPLASAEAVLFEDERELGVVIIDVGGGTTDVALVREGAVWHSAILPLGGDHITNDVAIGLRTPVADAEALKKRHGAALSAQVNADDTLDVPSVGGRKPRQLSRQVLAGIIQPRLEEIFGLVLKGLARVGFQDAATAGFVVTGGTSIMEALPDLAERVLGQAVRRGAPAAVDGLVEAATSPIYATGVGLALYGARRGPTTRMVAEGTGERGTLGRLRRRFAAALGDLF